MSFLFLGQLPDMLQGPTPPSTRERQLPPSCPRPPQSEEVSPDQRSCGQQVPAMKSNALPPCLESAGLKANGRSSLVAWSTSVAYNVRLRQKVLACRPKRVINENGRAEELNQDYKVLYMRFLVPPYFSRSLQVQAAYLDWRHSRPSSSRSWRLPRTQPGGLPLQDPMTPRGFRPRKVRFAEKLGGPRQISGIPAACSDSLAQKLSPEASPTLR